MVCWGPTAAPKLKARGRPGRTLECVDCLSLPHGPGKKRLPIRTPLSGHIINGISRTCIIHSHCIFLLELPADSHSLRLTLNVWMPRFRRFCWKKKTHLKTCVAMRKWSGPYPWAQLGVWGPPDDGTPFPLSFAPSLSPALSHFLH